MNKTTYLTVTVALLSVPVVTYIGTLYTECYAGSSFRDRPIASYNGACSWERGDGRCNIDSDCCPGRECNSFGMCQDCQ